LNHLTVPVVIFFSNARKRVPRGNHAANFNFVDVIGKGARGRIQQGTAANRTSSIYIILTVLQGRKPNCFGIRLWRSDRGASSRCRRPAARHCRLTCPRENDHVDGTELHCCDKQTGLSEAGDECRRHCYRKIVTKLLRN
jgi:hypothetical protein